MQGAGAAARASIPIEQQADDFHGVAGPLGIADVVARGHDPERRGDLLLPQLQGLRLALDGNIVSGTEDGDELGLALRGYAPVIRSGEVVGAVMIADPLDERLSLRLSGDAAAGTVVSVEPANASAEGCHAPNGDGPAACFFTVPSPSAQPAATVRLRVPLAEIQAARDDAQRALWIVGAVACSCLKYFFACS